MASWLLGLDLRENYQAEKPEASKNQFEYRQQKFMKNG